MKAIIVIETCERDIQSVTKCNSIEDAIDTANALLESHADNIDYVEELENKEGEGYDWQFASKDNLNAWCNIRNYNWDAHIVEL